MHNSKSLILNSYISTLISVESDGCFRDEYDFIPVLEPMHSRKPLIQKSYISTPDFIRICCIFQR